MRQRCLKQVGVAGVRYEAVQIEMRPLERFLAGLKLAAQEPQSCGSA